MSLGAIDFGLVVDSSVVMVENCVRRLAHDRSNRAKLAIIRDAAVEVRKPTMFGELIIMIVYLPILTLEGIEGKLFRPMALTVIFALVGLARPVADAHARAGLARPPAADVREGDDRRPPGPQALPADPRARAQLPDDRRSSSSALITVVATILGLRLGSEFVPRLNEGSVVINTIRLASVSLEESLRYGTRIEGYLKKQFPDEIRGHLDAGPGRPRWRPTRWAWSSPTSSSRSRTARAVDEGEDAGGARRRRWPRRRRCSPACGPSTRSPSRCESTRWWPGIRSDLGIKLYGEDLETLKAKAAEIEQVIKSIPGAADIDDRAGDGPARS